MYKHDRMAQGEQSHVASIRETLSAAGCLDFAALSDGQVLAWLAALGVWPEGMLPSVDLPSLGLTPEDLDTATASAKKAAELRRRRRTELDFGIAPSTFH